MRDEPRLVIDSELATDCNTHSDIDYNLYLI